MTLHILNSLCSLIRHNRAHTSLQLLPCGGITHAEAAVELNTAEDQQIMCAEFVAWMAFIPCAQLLNPAALSQRRLTYRLHQLKANTAEAC